MNVDFEAVNLSRNYRSIYALVILLLSFTYPATAESAIESRCDIEEVVESDGVRRMALIVGVGEYALPRVKDLKGPPTDAVNMFNLLSGPNGYAFPEQNICMLVDEDVTLDRFVSEFNDFLLANSRKDDVVVVYFAGHGRQHKDTNGDESDEHDEAWVFHDYSEPGHGELLDDTFNTLLTKLAATDAQITVILDSCHSGTATRDGDTINIARFFDDTESRDSIGVDDAQLERFSVAAVEDFRPDSFSNVVLLTAASDGTVALERSGSGIFTDALVEVMGQVSNKPLSYRQVARQITPIISARSRQTPFVSGELDTIVFANELRKRPVSWEVTNIAPELHLKGPPLPGIGVGAEYRIYDASIEGASLYDPGQAKALVGVTESQALFSKASVLARFEASEEIQIGDTAILARPADSYTKLSVRLHAEREHEAVGNTTRLEFEQELMRNEEAKLLISLQESAADFEIRQKESDNTLVLYGPENAIRAELKTVTDAISILHKFAKQAALAQLRGEGGMDFSDDKTLSAQLVKSETQPPCAHGSWIQSPPNNNQIVPLCHAYNLKVKHDGDIGSPPLLAGALILSADGEIIGLPADGRETLLQPGDEMVFDVAAEAGVHHGENFYGGLPLNIWDTYMVFGTQKGNPVSWKDLSTSPQTRAGLDIPTGSLSSRLDKYLQPGTRGVGRPPVVEIKKDNLTWTKTTFKAKVEANTRFTQPDGATIDSREYTLKNFDIRPYFPDNKSTALYKVLSKANDLARSSMPDGYGYKQHSWNQGSDEANLKKGIDCSRAIWFSFTRAGLPYNDNSDEYLPTVSMVSNDSLMSHEFKRCDAEPLELGDVLVYRDDTRGDGHVVMVIDAEKRIAWGSHGWDGNGRDPLVEPDTGVEFQLIKYKQDWQRWDRSTMERKACWRYKAFERDRNSGTGQPGIAALNQSCFEEGMCSLNQ